MPFFTLVEVEGTKPGEPLYQVISNTPLGEVDRTSKGNFNLNFTSFIRSASINSIDLETPSKEEEETGSYLLCIYAPSGNVLLKFSVKIEVTLIWLMGLCNYYLDDDEPLQSGMGEVSKYCTDEQLTAWSELVTNWPVNSTARPKQLTTLVRSGIPGNSRFQSLKVTLQMSYVIYPIFRRIEPNLIEIEPI
jgi:hypothetical protein